MPPPPTLLGHDKVIRGIQEKIENGSMGLRQQQEEIQNLKRKLDTAMYRIDLLTNYVRELRHLVPLTNPRR